MKRQIHSVDHAVDARDDRLHDFIEVPTAGTSLRGKSITVIGAGPTGLVFARHAATLGARVIVIEQGLDPRVDAIMYTDRSFNITLDEVGRQVLGHPSAWEGGIWLHGRAVHTPGCARYAPYGHSSNDMLLSIPRQRLRRNLVSLAEKSGARLLFDRRVLDADPYSGIVEYQMSEGSRASVSADLVIFADGLHSLADSIAAGQVTVTSVAEPRTYLAAYIRPEHTAQLSKRHIHFWHEPVEGNYTIGIPNADSSISLLVVSQFSHVAAHEHPYPTPHAARRHLPSHFPRLLEVAPEISAILPSRRRGQFTFKTIDRYVVGEKGVIAGDAACTVPPWAGYGANTSMYAATALVNLLARRDLTQEQSLAEYCLHMRGLTSSLMQFAADQGEFLSSAVATDPAGRSEDALAPLVRAALTDVQLGASSPDAVAAEMSASAAPV